jgi:hypothetical protein
MIDMFNKQIFQPQGVPMNNSILPLFADLDAFCQFFEPTFSAISCRMYGKRLCRIKSSVWADPVHAIGNRSRQALSDDDQLLGSHDLSGWLALRSSNRRQPASRSVGGLS